MNQQKNLDWKNLLRGAFAFMEAPFGIHPLDRRRAIKMFHAAIRQGAGLADVIYEAERYMHQMGFSQNRIAEEIRRIKEFSPNPMAKSRMAKAWIVTLESTEKPSEVLSIFKVQRSSESIRQYVEQLHIDMFYSPREKMIYAVNRKGNPYPAEFDTINGIPWGGRITCGHNPFLSARFVSNLQVIEDKDGKQSYSWNEVPPPNICSSNAT